MSDRNVSIAVGTTNVVLSEQKDQQRRVSFSIINTSTGGQVISITFTDEAGAGLGIPLSAGGFYSEAESEGFKCTRSRICAISSLAGGTIAMTERLE